MTYDRQYSAICLRSICNCFMVVIFVGLLASVSISASAQSSPVDRIPAIAIDDLKKSGFVVLDRKGVVNLADITIDNGVSTVKLHRIVSLPGDEAPVDMTLAEQGNDSYVFVLAKKCIFGKDTPCFGIIHKFDIHMQLEIRSFRLDAVGTGLDYDGTTGTLYFATEGYNAIYAIPTLDKDPKISQIGAITSIGRIGPLGVLPGKPTRIYLGDVLNGGLFLFDVNSHLVRRLEANLGDTTALLVSRATRELYVGDASRRRITIFRIAASGNISSPEGLSKAEGQIGTPHSIAFVSGGVAIADTERGNLLIFDKNWKLTKLVVQ